MARRRFRRNWSHSDVSTLLDHQPWVYFSAAKRSHFRFGQKDSTIDGVLPVMLPWLQFEETASDPHVIGIGPRVSLPYEAIFDPHTMLPVDRVGLNPASFWRAVEDFTRDAGWNAQAELFAVSADSEAFLILDAQPNDFSYVSQMMRQFGLFDLVRFDLIDAMFPRSGPVDRREQAMRTTLYDAITGFAIQLAQVPQEATTPAGPRLDSSLLHNAQMHSSGLMAGIETLDVVCATILDKGCNDSRVDFIQAECARVHTIRGMNRWVAAVLDFAKYGLEPQ